MENQTLTQPVVTSSAAKLWFVRMLAIFRGEETLAPKFQLITLFSALVLICGTAAFIGAVPTKIYGHDIFIYLGNGWRVLNGQRPHVDFTSPWGPIGFLASALGLFISRHSALGIGYGSAIVGFIIGTWCFFLGRKSLQFFPRLILSLFLAAVAAAPYPLGLSPFMSSYAMIYNRYGYALLGLVLVEVFKRPSESIGSQWSEWIDGISTGAVLSLLLFLKASYFFVALALIAILGWLLRRFAVRYLLAIALGFSFISTCVLAYLRFDVTDVVKDLRMAAGARAETMQLPFGIFLNHWPVLLGVIFFCVAASLLLDNQVPHWRSFKLPLLGAVLFGTDISVIRSNAQADGFLVCAMFAIFVMNEIMENQKTLAPAAKRAQRPAYVAVLFLGALLLLPQFVSDLMGLAYGAWEKERRSNAAGLLHFASPNLKPLLLFESEDNPPSEGRMFTTYINEGVALLQREARPDEKILTMDVTNPFPYAMERRPPRGGHAASTYNYNMTDKYRPTDDWYFGDADLVMVPKRPSQGDKYYAGFFRAYGPGLKQRYALAAETSLWWLYRRK